MALPPHRAEPNYYLDLLVLDARIYREAHGGKHWWLNHDHTTPCDNCDWAHAILYDEAPGAKPQGHHAA